MLTNTFNHFKGVSQRLLTSGLQNTGQEKMHPDVLPLAPDFLSGALSGTNS